MQRRSWRAEIATVARDEDAGSRELMQLKKKALRAKIRKHGSLRGSRLHPPEADRGALWTRAKQTLGTENGKENSAPKNQIPDSSAEFTPGLSSSTTSSDLQKASVTIVNWGAVRLAHDYSASELRAGHRMDWRTFAWKGKGFNCFLALPLPPRQLTKSRSLLMGNVSELLRY
ncbi:hypothetical protein L218DRAFT_992314 [Marasmius fiardii PR-910]|nr:hypothetical protein L218DRAFT_992314 [Marasmius fiardii PR-910]